ncbi:MAG TPA: hypothetical protein VF174_04860 [Micromonosporaceae bacterium]
MSESPSPPSSFDPLSQSAPPTPVPPPPPAAPTAYPGGASVPAPAPAPEPLAYPGGAHATPPAPTASTGTVPPAPDPLTGPLAKIPVPALLWAQVVGGVMVAISTFLPWATWSVSASFLGQTHSESGSANGWSDEAGQSISNGGLSFVVLILGLAIAALALVTVLKIKLPFQVPPVAARYAPAGAALLVFLMAFFKWISVLGDVSDLKDQVSAGLGGLGVLAGLSASVHSGVGIWFLVLFALVTLAGAGLPVVAKFIKPKAA